MAAAVGQTRLNATKTTFTPEQRRAVNTRDVSVALSAGAGCGKTFVLTERYLSHLDPSDGDAPPCDLSQLVAITFTDRAAREMRDRIRAKCFERLQQAPPEHGDYWLGLLRSLDSARVSTIHSFCGTLLRSHAAEAALDPQFGVLEAAQAETLLAQQIDDLLRAKLAARDEDVLELVTQFGLARLREHLADLFDRCRSRSYQYWLERQPQDLVDRWTQFHRRHVLPSVARRVTQSQGAVKLLSLLREIAFDHAELRQRQEDLLRLLPGLCESANLLADLEVIREQAKVVRNKKAWPSGDVYERFRDSAKALRDEIDKCVDHVDFDPAAARASAELGLAMLRLVAQVERAYEAAKAELAVLDFDDLLIRARRLLTDPKHNGLRQRWARDTRLLLVDECQDTDPVQVELIKALCGDNYRAGNLFFVGDFKQSIYRFRGADPAVFRRLQAETPDRGRLPLSRNFRSQPAILQFVNAVFCQALAGEDLPYEPLVPHRDQTYAGPAVEFMWCVADHVDDSQQSATAEQAPAEDNTNGVDREARSVEALRRREADWIARRICQLLAGTACDGVPPLELHNKSSTEPRGVRKGDIAILFRTLSDVAFYEEALRGYGIDYYLVGGHAFYAQQEIYDVLNLLRSLVSQADEVSLAGALRSPFFSLTDETLFWLAEHERGLWAGLCAERLPAEIDDQERGRVTLAARVLQDLRARKDRLPIAELLCEAFSRTGYDAALLGEFLGERKLANLRKLIAQARDFDRAGVMSLADFIVQLSQFVVRQPREPLAATHPEATDVVRLMTIHQSKGLEFPVVFVPDLDRASNDRSRAADYSDDLGPLVGLPNDHEHHDALNGHRLYEIACSAEDKQEAIRLFYVAATRAADFLVLSSGLKSLAAPKGPAMQLLAERFDVSTGRLVAALPQGYTAPRVRVLTLPPPVDIKRRAGHAGVDLEKIVQEIEAAAEPDGQGPLSADPIPCDASARRRFSVSGLRETIAETPPWRLAETSGRSSNEAASDAVKLGIVVHAALSSCDLHNRNALASLVLQQADKHQVREAATRDEALRLVQGFFDSSRAVALREARRLLREVEFLLTWPPVGDQAAGVQASACTVLSDSSSTRYLQGYLDCLYQDAAGRWHVIDYKTNQVSPSTIAAVVAEYEMQMLAYGLAAEQALGEPIAGLTLHFLRTGDEHTFEWNDHTRERAIRLVDRAIQSQCSSLMPDA